MRSFLFMSTILLFTLLGSLQQHTCVVHVESPIYNSVARQARLEGEIEVQLRVAPNGRVVSATATSGHSLLKQSAEANVREWIFNSGVERTLTVVYEFRLVEPERYHEPPTHVTFDLPYRVRVVSHFKPIMP
jgi:hypothetical protein